MTGKLQLARIFHTQNIGRVPKIMPSTQT